MEDNSLNGSLGDFEAKLLDIRDNISSEIAKFNALREEYKQYKSADDIQPLSESLLTDENDDDYLTGRASKYWGISRAILDVLLASSKVVTRFSLLDLKRKLPKEYADAPNDTLHAAIHYLKMKNTKYSHRANMISLNNPPTGYGISYHSNGNYTFYNYRILVVTHGKLV